MVWKNGYEEFVATPFSYNALTYSLEKEIKTDGTIVNSFSVISRPPLTAIESYAIEDCTNSTGDTCAIIEIEYKPQKKDGEFFVQHNEEYISYQWPDLLSGIGGIVSTADGIVATCLSILLLGFGCFCVQWNGLAPYPHFDDNFKERLQRFID
eukprot:325646_1